MGRKRPLLQRNLGGRHRRDVRLRRVHGLRVVGRELRFQGDEALAADQTVGWSGIDPCWAIRAGERDSVPFDSDCHSLGTAENDRGCQSAKPLTTSHCRPSLFDAARCAASHCFWWGSWMLPRLDSEQRPSLPGQPLHGGGAPTG